MSQRIPELYVSPSELGGRGVFCGVDIPAKSLIEICPVIVIPKKDIKPIDKTILHDYYFEWGKKFDKGALALGFGSLYNHSSKPNAYYKVDYEESVLFVYALKKIAAGKEICFNYNGNPKDKSRVWFEGKK